MCGISSTCLIGQHCLNERREMLARTVHSGNDGAGGRETCGATLPVTWCGRETWWTSLMTGGMGRRRYGCDTTTVTHHPGPAVDANNILIILL